MEFYQYFAISPSFSCSGPGCLTAYGGTLPRAYTFGGAQAMQVRTALCIPLALMPQPFLLQTFLNFNATAASNAQAIQQELPAMMSTADARAVEGLTITATLFTALALAGCTVSKGAHVFDGCGIVSGKNCDC
jgi:hypothetical protein